MKNLLYIFAVVGAVLLPGCSSDSTCEQSSSGDNFDLYGVANWDNPADFTIGHYYTLVDTITLKRPNISVVIKATDNLDASVNWTIDGKKYDSYFVDGIYNNAQGINVRTFYPFPPDGFEYTDGMVVAAEAKVGTNTIQRQETIKEQSIERNVLCVNFDMSVDEVAEEIMSLKGAGKFIVREDGVGYENAAPHFTGGGKTFYIFDAENDGGLIEVAEFPASFFGTDEDGETTGGLSGQFLAFCRRLGLEEDIILTLDGTLARDYQWEREGIIFTVHARDDVFPLDGDEIEDGDEQYEPYSIGISFKPAE